MFPAAPWKLISGNLLSSSPLQLQPKLHSWQHAEEKQTVGYKRPLLQTFCSCSAQKELQQLVDEDVSVMCEPCNGRGWLLCELCQGKKNDVKSQTGRIYRRCPTCKAVGYTLCPKCKVYKCVTFPDSSDGRL